MRESLRATQKSELRERLYQVALQLFRSQGFDATKVIDITAAAGVSKGTFFNYFPAKQHLLREWYRRITVETLAEIRAREIGNARDAIAELLSSLAVRATADPDLFAMKTRYALADEMMGREERQLDQDLSSFLRATLEDGEERGEFAEEFDCSLCTDVILAVLTGTAHEWVVGGQTMDLSASLIERVDFIF